MMEQYYHSKKLFHFKVQMDKDKASFLYFTLEASEGLCFYSTAEFEVGQSSRIVDIWGAIEWREEVKRILESLSQSLEFHSIEEEIVTDTTGSLL